MPPADRRFLLQDLEDEARRRAFLASPLYRAFSEQEMRYWGSFHEETPPEAPRPAVPETASLASVPQPPARIRYYKEHPVVEREIHRRACPDAPDIWQLLLRKFPARRHGLVLGAGDGNHCRLLVDYRIAAQVTAYDLAADAVLKARAEYGRLKYPIDYQVADLNFIEFGAAKFDLCLALHSLHHIIDLEGLFSQLHRALAPAGAFVMEEYVGPRHLEFPRPARELAREIFRRLPERFRMSPGGGSVMERLEFQDRWAVQRYSPFEAIRSDRVLPLLESRFEIEVQNVMGGGLLMMLLDPIVHNFDPADPEANALLRQILEEDLRLTQQNKIPNCLTLLIARPK